MIYLDNAATTRPFDSVIQRMETFYKEAYFNPSALYAPAMRVEDELEKARDYINNVLGGGGKVFFTSCATESNTWVYHSARKNKKGNVVVSMGEHASGYENAQALLGQGIDVRFVRLTKSGAVDMADFMQKIDADTCLVSIIHCSNETGAVNDLRALSDAVKRVAPQALFHSDGVQALGKLPVHCCALGVDLYSVSAHKIGGAKGVGALWVRDGIRLQPLIVGGGQEQNTRSGTENVAGIVGFAEALRVFLQTDGKQIAMLRQNMQSALAGLENVTVHNAQENSPYILSFSVLGLKAEILQRKLAEQNILIGLGSACASRWKKNRVLAAMGYGMPHIEGNVRISFGANNLQDDMVYAQKTLIDTINALRTNIR